MYCIIAKLQVLNIKSILPALSLETNLNGSLSKGSLLVSIYEISFALSDRDQ